MNKTVSYYIKGSVLEALPHVHVKRRSVLYDRFCGRTYKNIASDLGVSTGRAQQLYRAGLRDLARMTGHPSDAVEQVLKDYTPAPFEGAPPKTPQGSADKNREQAEAGVISTEIANVACRLGCAPLRNGIDRVIEVLSRHNAAQLLSLRNVGPAAVRNVQTFLEAHGRSLRDDWPDPALKVAKDSCDRIRQNLTALPRSTSDQAHRRVKDMLDAYEDLGRAIQSLRLAARSNFL